MKKEKKDTPAGKDRAAEHHHAADKDQTAGTAPGATPGTDKSRLPKLPVTDQLKEKLKKSRKQDPNIYPLW
jgi:hypothetical protein